MWVSGSTNPVGLSEASVIFKNERLTVLFKPMW